MTEDRLEIVKQVLFGNLSDEYITLEEAQEALAMVEEAIMEKEIERLSISNPFVFSGTDVDRLH